MSTRVLVFGTFDLFHPGHEFVLEQAAKLGDELHVAVARDSHVQQLKNKIPARSQEARLATITSQPGVTSAQLSDETLGSYGVVRDVRPDVIALGHDQSALEVDLRRWMKEQGIEIEIARLPKHV